MFRGIAGEAYENLALDRIEKNGEWKIENGECQM
jgi:hypothetical protein